MRCPICGYDHLHFVALTDADFEPIPDTEHGGFSVGNVILNQDGVDRINESIREGVPGNIELKCPFCFSSFSVEDGGHGNYFIEKKKITVWSRFYPDDFGGHWEHNHIEDDWVEGDRPVGNAEQTKHWAGHKWQKKFYLLVDGVVKATSEYAWEQKMKKDLPHREELLEYPEEISIKWCVDDVLNVAENNLEIKLTRQEAAHVLHEVEKNHDCNCGVTWRTIEAWIDVLYGDRIAEA